MGTSQGFGDWPVAVQGVEAGPESIAGQGNQALDLREGPLDMLPWKMSLVDSCLLLLFSYLCCSLVLYLPPALGTF